MILLLDTHTEPGSVHSTGQHAGSPTKIPKAPFPKLFEFERILFTCEINLNPPEAAAIPAKLFSAIQLVNTKRLLTGVPNAVGLPTLVSVVKPHASLARQQY